MNKKQTTQPPILFLSKNGLVSQIIGVKPSVGLQIDRNFLENSKEIIFCILMWFSDYSTIYQNEWVSFTWFWEGDFFGGNTWLYSVDIRFCRRQQVVPISRYFLTFKLISWITLKICPHTSTKREFLRKIEWKFDLRMRVSHRTRTEYLSAERPA